MNDAIKLWRTPLEKEMVMIAGWRQWADAGAISSGLPQYLIELTGAEKIGEVKTDGFYMFQIPGMHFLLRPIVRFENGAQTGLEIRRNEIFYTEDLGKGLVIFLGDEPHMDVDRYSRAFFDVAKALNVQQIVTLGGVYGPVPYDKDREVGCTFSLPQMRTDLETYAVRFSNYEGGASIGSYLLNRATQEHIKYLSFYGFVPNYDFSQISDMHQGEIRVENDFKAWYDIMRRINHLFEVEIYLGQLEKQSYDLMDEMENRIKELERKTPELKVREFFEQVNMQFHERPFQPLGNVWEEGLQNLFDDLDE